MTDSAVFHDTSDDSFRDASGPITEFPTSGGGGAELDFVTQATRLDVSATTAATANTFMSSNAVTYDGSTRIRIEFHCPLVAASQFISIDLWDGSTDLGIIAQFNATGPVLAVAYLTPSAGSHTFHIKGWRGTGTSAFECGAGGAGTRRPATLRITEA